MAFLLYYLGQITTNIFSIFVTMKTIEIRTVNVVQYKQALREGGSLPAIVKADDDFNYVLKLVDNSALSPLEIHKKITN